MPTNLSKNQKTNTIDYFQPHFIARITKPQAKKRGHVSRRHAFADLIEAADLLLSENGIFAVIILSKRKMLFWLLPRT
jgi:tRNA1(Val) A37 N6-methylase TrmN6